jgi:hypothetical protein
VRKNEKAGQAGPRGAHDSTTFDVSKGHSGAICLPATTAGMQAGMLGRGQQRTDLGIFKLNIYKLQLLIGKPIEPVGRQMD